MLVAIGLELIDALEEGALMRLRREDMGRSSTGMGKNAHVRCVAEGFQARLLFEGQVCSQLFFESSCCCYSISLSARQCCCVPADSADMVKADLVMCSVIHVLAFFACKNWRAWSCYACKA